MPCSEEKELNHLYRNANLPSWKYRTVDLHLTQTHINGGLSGLKGIDEKKFKPIFAKQVKEDDELVLDPKRKQCDDLLNYLKTKRQNG